MEGSKNKQMEQQAFMDVRHALLVAEEDFHRSTKQSRGIKAAAEAISKLRQIRVNKQSVGEDCSGIETLLAHSEEKFHSSLGRLDAEACSSSDITDFKVWARELQTAARLHDPLLLSFDSDPDEDDMFGADYLVASSKSNRSMTSSKIILKMTPIGKHHDETFRYLESTSRRQAKIFTTITVAAWTFAVLCMLLALGFLTSEFIQSQRNPAIRIEQVPSEVVELPSISICNVYEGLPSFENYPTPDYPGHPIFAITVISNTHDDTMPAVYYPDTVTSDIVEPTYQGMDAGKCERDTSKMSIDRSRRALFRYSFEENEKVVGVPTDDKPCLKCFRIGFRKRFKLRSSDPRVAGKMPVVVNVATSRAYGLCNLSFEKRAPVNSFFFFYELRKHAPQLEQKGIIAFKNAPLTQEEKLRAFNRFEQASLSSFLQMACNVYFFAGYFYPSEDEGKVKWEWDGESNQWKNVGERAFSWITRQVPEVQISASGDRSGDIFMGKGVEIYYEDPGRISESSSPSLIGRKASAAFLSGPSTSHIYFTRTNEGNGENTFTADADTSIISDALIHIDRYMKFNLGKKTMRFQSTHRRGFVPLPPCSSETNKDW